jgi:two-component system, chemotaxis family, sensor kinase CheA
MAKQALKLGTAALHFDLDDEDVKLFCDETEEQIELLDASLVQFERRPDAELVQRIFRAAHTLKGSSFTIGHAKMAGLTHAMETVLDAVRLGRMAPSRPMVDALLAAVDALRVLAQEVVTRVESGVDTEELEATLLAIIDAEHVEATADAGPAPASMQLSPAELDEVARQANGGRIALHVTVTIEPGSQLPSVRCFQVLQELETLASVIRTWPARAVIEAGGAEFDFEAVVTTSADEGELRGALSNISDIGTIAIADFGGEAGVAPARPALRLVGGSRQPEPARALARRPSPSIRIDVERLDGMMNLVGELVIDRTRLQQIREHLRLVHKDANLSGLVENLEETTSHLARITDELQEEIMRSRMLPVRSVLARLPRLVRDVAAKCGKKVEFATAGEETELDRAVIEEISDPLIHILRNAIDHGIETPGERLAAGKRECGHISVTAWNQETYIYLAVKDDGRGIDTARLRSKAIERGLVTREAAEFATDAQVLQYIFIPGLSTASAVSDVSGRGVGMDIVRTNIERLNGQVTVASEPGQGSEFIIQLPLTLATTKALMVVANSTVYALPLVSVTEALSEANAEIYMVAGRPTLRLREKLLPVIELASALGDEPSRHAAGGRYVVATRHGDRQVAFMVDRLLGEQDVVVKSLGEMFGNRVGLTGATILGDGSLGLIVDTATLVNEQAKLSASAPARRFDTGTLEGSWSQPQTNW